MEKTEYSGADLNYLRESEAEDIKQTIKPIEYTELSGHAKDEEELAKRIESLAGDEARETQTEEFVILDRKVKSELPCYDFYIARRHRQGKVFEPETVLVAKSKGRHFLQKLHPMQALKYEPTDEVGKMLSSEERHFLEEENKQERTSSDSYVAIEKSENKEIGHGGFSVVRQGMRRGKGKFTPDRIALKETHEHIRNKKEFASEKAVLSTVKVLKSLSGEAWKYVADPIDALESDKHSGVWELVSSQEGKNFKVEDLKSKIKKKELLSQEKFIIIRQLFETLSAMAKTGVAHNDIKPANILLTGEGIKLIDFGLMHFSKKFMDSDLLKKAERNAKLIKKKEGAKERNYDLPEHFEAAEYSQNIAHGTIGYIHPRLMSGYGPEKAEDFNPRYDVYQAVVTAIELLTDGKTGPSKICPSEKFFDLRMFYDFYEYFSGEMMKILREKFKKEMEKPAFAKFVGLLEQGLNDGLGRNFRRPPSELSEEEVFVEPDYSIEEEKRMEQEKNIPIENLLPAPEEFVDALKKMGVKESF